MARRFGRDRSSSNNSRSSFKYLQQSFGRRSKKKRVKTKERFVVVVVDLLLIVVVVGRRKKRVFPNQKLEEVKNINKVLSLDPPRNHKNHHQQLHFHVNHNQLLQQQEPPSPQKQQTTSAAASASSFHGFHAHFFQQPQEFQQQQQQHQFLYGIGEGLELESPPPPPQPLKKRSFLPSSSQTKEYATGLRRKMGDNSTTPPPSSSRFGISRNTTGSPVGEIVEVQGGHIVRSTGRKDRHSKVCTAKGPRDRRVRLSAHTAIQFYDVQDRLGYDRPSKAVDWLIKKAKAAIDELKELPAWIPTTAFPILNPSPNINQSQQQLQHQQQQQNLHVRREQQPPKENNSNSSNNNNSSFLPPSMDSDSIADTVKSFFPMVASTESNSSPGAANLQFHHSFPQDLLSRTTSQSQNLRLSLQSFQDPMVQHQHQHQHQNDDDQPTCLYSNNPQMIFDGSCWSETNQPEMGRFQRLVSWNAGGESNAGGSGAFVFHAPSPAPLAHHHQQPMLQTLLGQSSLHQQLFSQRGPLQSSNTPSVRAWIDPSSAFSNDDDHQNSHSQMPFHHHGSSSLAGFGFANNVGGFSRFRIPARIQGAEEMASLTSHPLLPPRFSPLIGSSVVESSFSLNHRA